MSNCYFSVEDEAEQYGYFRIYPNPASNQVTISGIHTGQGNPTTFILSGMEEKILFSGEIGIENPSGTFTLQEYITREFISLGYPINTSQNASNS